LLIPDSFWHDLDRFCRLIDQTKVQPNHHTGVKTRMVFALFIEDSWKSIFILYLAMPLFIIFLVYTLLLRERDTKLHLREIMHNIIRTLFK